MKERKQERVALQERKESSFYKKWQTLEHGRERERERFIFQAMEFVQQDEDKQKFAGTNQTYNKIIQIKYITNNTEPEHV